MKKKLITCLSNDFQKSFVRKLRKLLHLPMNGDPWMEYKEIDIFLEVLGNLKPQKSLEYGCGFSSLYYPNFLPQGATWTSVEHNTEWFEKIQKDAAKIKGLKLINVKPEVASWTQGGSYSDFKNYVDYARSLNQKFDLILVDGVAREACIDAALDLLSDNGVLVVHDCNRVRYQPHLKKFPHWLIFEDFRKTAGGFGFATKKRKIEELFDVKLHSKIWDIDTKIVNIFKFKYLIGKASKPFKLESNSL